MTMASAQWPRRRYRAASSRDRREAGHRAGRQLHVHDVTQPLGHEILDVHVERGGGAEGLCVARPAEAFVALRTIGWHAQEIATLAPLDVRLELVEVRVGALEAPAERHRAKTTRPTMALGSGVPG
jgi:hypothetical protein